MNKTICGWNELGDCRCVRDEGFDDLLNEFTERLIKAGAKFEIMIEYPSGGTGKYWTAAINIPVHTETTS